MANQKIKVSCFTVNGEFIRQFDSLSEAKRVFGAEPSNIRRAANNHTPCRKMYWRIDTIAPNHSTERKPVWQWLPNGTFCAEYESCMQAERLTGAQARNIARCAKGSQWSAGGYRWTFKGTKLFVEPNPRTYANCRSNLSTAVPVQCVPIDWRKQGGGVLEDAVLFFPSITQAQRELNLNESSRSEIGKCRKGTRLSAVGFYWFDESETDVPARVREIEQRIADSNITKRATFRRLNDRDFPRGK